MNTSLSARVVQSLAVLGCAVALLFTALWVSHLAEIYKLFYYVHNRGKALPALTRMVLGLTEAHRVVAIGALAGIVCLAIGYRKTQEGYKWIAEQEIHFRPKIFNTVDGWTREQLVVQYQIEPVKDLPLRKTCVSYVGTDPRLARRFDLTLNDVEPILAEWKKEH